jgi:hypothetical protein
MSRYIPKLNTVLRSHLHLIAPSLKLTDSGTNGWMQRMLAITQPQENVGIHQIDHD